MKSVYRAVRRRNSGRSRGVFGSHNTAGWFDAPLFLPFVGLLAIKFFRGLDLLQLWCEMIMSPLLAKNYFDIKMRRLIHI